MKPDRRYLAGAVLLVLVIAAAAAAIVFLKTDGTDSGPGAMLYQEYCSACHGRDGSGLRALYPPLAESPYLSGKDAELACLIRRGIRGALVTADGSFNQRMPAFTNLTAADISQLIAFLQERWGSARTTIRPKQLERWLLSCP